MAKNDGEWIIWLGVALLGAAAVNEILTPKFPCPFCAATVKEGAPACWRCKNALEWEPVEEGEADAG